MVHFFVFDIYLERLVLPKFMIKNHLFKNDILKSYIIKKNKTITAKKRIFSKNVILRHLFRM